MLICHLGLLQNVEFSVYKKLDYHRHLFGKYFVFIKLLFLIDDLFISLCFSKTSPHRRLKYKGPTTF